jgi:hypothetical protein
MISTLQQVNSFVHNASLNAFGAILLAVTLCVVLPVFLVVVTFGSGRSGVSAIATRSDRRRNRFRDGRERVRLSAFKSGSRSTWQAQNLGAKMSREKFRT